MNLSKKVRFDQDKLNKSLSLLTALNNPLRKEILQVIDKEVCIDVNSIWIKMRNYKLYKVDQSVISQHLAILRDANIVFYDKQGKYHLYKINYDVINRVDKVVTEFNEIYDMTNIEQDATV